MYYLIKTTFRDATDNKLQHRNFIRTDKTIEDAIRRAQEKKSYYEGLRGTYEVSVTVQEMQPVGNVHLII